MSDLSSTLRSRIIRQAHTNVALRPHLLPLLKEADLQGKQAGKDTFDFVLWALQQDAVPTNRVIQFLERHGVEFRENVPGDNKRGQPLKKGELVQVQVVNAPNDLKDLLRPFDTQKGTIVDVDGDDIVIEFQGTNKTVRVPGGVTAGKASGIYRTTQFDFDSTPKAAHIEVVYAAANERPPSNFQVQQVKEYVEKGLSQGEARASNYYTGYVSSYKISKEGHPYFLLSSQQRGGDMRSLSPNKGTVYYIGIVGQRPAGWLRELEQLEAKAIAG